MVTNVQSVPFSNFIGGLPRRLINDGLLTEDQAREAQAKAAKTDSHFVSVAVESKLINPTRLAEIASVEFGTPLIDLSTLTIEAPLAREISEKLMRKHHVLPIYKRDRKLFVALSDPTRLHALDEVKFATR